MSSTPSSAADPRPDEHEEHPAGERPDREQAEKHARKATDPEGDIASGGGEQTR